MDERERTVMNPVLVLREAERVNIKPLVMTDNGLAVDADAVFRYIGDVTVEKVEVNGLEVKRWFAWTLTGTSLGPQSNRVKAIQALLTYYGMRQTDVRETMTPLF